MTKVTFSWHTSTFFFSVIYNNNIMMLAAYGCWSKTIAPRRRTDSVLDTGKRERGTPSRSAGRLSCVGRVLCHLSSGQNWTLAVNSPPPDVGGCDFHGPFGCKMGVNLC